MAATCAICGIRRSRRFCPGVNNDICSICCGTEREVTVSCPLECKYLAEARDREKAPLLSEKDLPYPEIKVTENFLESQEALLLTCGRAVAAAALKGTAYDSDVREAINALARTYLTLQSGLYYETRPENPIAAAVQDHLREQIDELTKMLKQESGMETIRDGDVLKILVFMLRLQLQYDNKRPKGRAFIHFLKDFFPMPEQKQESLLL